jgi:hypothetical protein
MFGSRINHTIKKTPSLLERFFVCVMFKAELCEDQKGILFSFFMFAIQSGLSQK